MLMYVGSENPDWEIQYSFTFTFNAHRMGIFFERQFDYGFLKDFVFKIFFIPVNIEKKKKKTIKRFSFKERVDGLPLSVY